MIKILFLLLLPFTTLALGTPVGNAKGAILGIYGMCGTNPVDCQNGWCCIAGQSCLSSTSTTGTPLCMDSSVSSPYDRPLANIEQKFRSNGQRRLLWLLAAPSIGPECHFHNVVRWHLGRRYDYQRCPFDSSHATLYGLGCRGDCRIPVALDVNGSYRWELESPPTPYITPL